ncbi:MAG TPA: 16S rRNA (adenine(1518)-N(6)/adenine(1519)-N(6))-dimethyltransferase RsmA [Stellaceae bacterium]|nr:16S rRNA (adenine(1518)-N(6)/adenine(1519)-N(6))-dimethyltransferase RsmA [Stellaceae bacterium]
MSRLPPLREVIRRHGLGARRALGQNFLLDLNLTGRIARAAGPLEAHEVIEIGPGPGGLTRALLEAGAKRVTAIERDPRAIAALRELAAFFPDRLSLIEGDAMTLDPAALVPPPRKIVANLPYNIATPLLIGWIPNLGAYESLTLMFQKEVAERLVASPRSKEYGRLSILTQWRAEIRLLFDIPPQAFVPPPKVTSTLVGLTPRPTPLAACLQADLERVTAAAFGQRRKMLRASLKSLGYEVEALLAAASIPPTARAEELSIPQFCSLARACGDLYSRRLPSPASLRSAPSPTKWERGGPGPRSGGG